jgi:ATP-binding cassette subfamily B protein
LLQLFLAIVPLVNLYILKGLVDLVLKQNSNGHNLIIYQILILLVVQIINAGLNQVYQYVQSLQEQKITDYVAAMVIQKAINVPYDHYENPKYHDSLHMAQYQALYKLPVLINAINQLIQQVFNMLFLSVLFITIKWYYFFLFVLLGLPLAYVKWYYSNKINLHAKRYVTLERQSGYLNLVLTSLGFAKEVRIFDFGKIFLDKFKGIRNKISKDKREIGYHNAWAGFWAQLIEIVSICYIYFKIAVQTFTGVISIGSFVMYFQAFQRLQASLKSFLQSLVELFQLRMFLTDLFLFLDIREEVKPFDKSVTFSEKGIEIENVSFTYPGSDKEVLKNISLKCGSGHITALVGENGSGKSTLVKLLTGLYRVQKGIIKVNGININIIPDEELRKMTSVIFQDFNMYDSSVKENIGLGAAFTDDNKIRASAEATGANDFVNELPYRYETLLGRSFNKSEQLSGGQWQKLALSRAFYRDTEIVILDEPTSHIDPLGEFTIIENLIKNIDGKIVILITHRLYNLKKAHCIYNMHEGKIVEAGTFDELILENGLFKRMYEKQKL